MNVPEDITKSVAFLALKMADGEIQLKGTAFLVGRESRKGGWANPVYAVTARHVIDGIRVKSLDVWFRINRRSGESDWFHSNVRDWYAHPTDTTIDVAILRVDLLPDWDHLVLTEASWITKEIMASEDVNLGNEVFITGLFHHHQGERKSIPIVRVGNLACMSEEKIQTVVGLIDGLLIEARSIGGLSGSPVFLNLGTLRSIGGQLRQRTSGPAFYLLGLVHGHYDVNASEIDEASPTQLDGLTVQRVNTGIAIVVPFHSILEVINSFEKNP